MRTGFEHQKIERRVARPEFVIGGAVVICLGIGNTGSRLVARGSSSFDCLALLANAQVLDQVS